MEGGTHGRGGLDSVSKGSGSGAEIVSSSIFDDSRTRLIKSTVIMTASVLDLSKRGYRAWPIGKTPCVFLSSLEISFLRAKE